MGSLLPSPQKEDEFIIKSTKWMSLLLTPPDGQAYFYVHKMDEFIIKSTKWTSLLLSPPNGQAYC